MDAIEETSLVQKLRDHWNTRDKIFHPSPHTANQMGVVFFWAATGSALYTAVWVVIPECDDQPVLGVAYDFWLKLLTCFLLFEIFINWNLCAMKHLSQVTSERVKKALERGRHVGEGRSVEMPVGFESCPTCQIAAPPRSHHCRVCNMCVLKRDHHCYFTGTCIGFYNQRYFLVLVFHVALGSIYTAALIIWYVGGELSVNSTGGPLRYLPPFAIWSFLFGTLSFSSFILLVELYVVLATFAVSAGFFVWQMLMVVRGQTSYEASRDIQRYRHGDVLAHLRSVFGPFWILNFLYPLRTLPDGDGFIWVTQKATKGN